MDLGLSLRDIGCFVAVADRLSFSRAAAELGLSQPALMSAPFPAGFAMTARFHVPVGHVAVPAGSPLATASRLSLPQLAAQDVLLPRSRPPGSLWARLPAVLRVTVEDLDDLPAGLDLVAAGRGVLLAPHLLVETVRRPDVRFIPLDAPGLRMTYALVWRQEGASAELMALVQAVQEIHRNLG